MSTTYAVWYELLPYADLCSSVLSLLEERAVAIYLAVTPDVVDGLADTVHLCREHGLRVGVWPMIEREHGRWPSAHNVDRFEAFVANVRDRLARDPDVLILDFEPPIEAMPALFGFDRKVIAEFLRRGIPRQAVTRYAALAEALGKDGIETVSAALPLILADGEEGGWQRFFGTPLDTTPTARVSSMLYTSIMEGFARHKLDRRDVLSVLAAGARATRQRFGGRASVSLGAIDVGALGDEPTYRSVAELREDVAITRAAGIEHIALFSLCGAMRRAPVQPWLDALVETEAGVMPEMTPRARGFVAAIWLASQAMTVGHRLLGARRRR